MHCVFIEAQDHLNNVGVGKHPIVVGDLLVPKYGLLNAILYEYPDYIVATERLINDSDLVVGSKAIVESVILQEHRNGVFISVLWGGVLYMIYYLQLFLLAFGFNYRVHHLLLIGFILIFIYY